MNNRSYALLLNGFVYSTLTAICTCGAIVKTDLGLLKLAIVFLMVTILSVLLSYIIDEEESPNKLILGFSFGLLIPVGILIFIVTFVTTFISELFNGKRIKEGD